MSELIPKDKYAAQKAYIKRTMKQIKFSLNQNTEADLIQWLEQCDNVTGYLKQLIRDDIKRKTE